MVILLGIAAHINILYEIIMFYRIIIYIISQSY